MTNRTVHRKKNGAAYVYSVESYWDKEKKAPRTKQVCLGRLNEETGEVTPSKPRTKKNEPKTSLEPIVSRVRAKVFGSYLLLQKLANETGLTRLLKQCMPNNYQELLSLAFFVAQKGVALSRCESWSENHRHPADKFLASQRVSELLKQVPEDRRQLFLSVWMECLLESEYLCYDITSISSYAVGNEYVRRGYNRDGDNLSQINLAMLYGQKSGLPAYYRRLPGNITDVSTLETTIDLLEFSGQEKLCFVLDRGFYSEDNISTLLEKRYSFALMTPTNRVWVKKIIDKYADNISSPERYIMTKSGEALYAISHPHRVNNKRCFAHIYYNATRAAEDFDALTKKLILCKKELENDAPISKNRDFYDRFFIVKRTPKRGLSVSYNEPEIQKYRNQYAGYFCILTNMKTDSQELVDIYRRKDVVENSFDDLKNSLDMKRLRVHSSAAMDTRLFIQFLALILLSKMRSILKTDKELWQKSPREIMEAMESIVEVQVLGSTANRLFTELGPLQQKIVDLFELESEA